ncbi:MAG TPA: HEPN domain-containing protein [Candidatus Gastranaerophilaceae bacterium]|nr:HEPN domain-containing protein [Candidatus Gastranaerophilaceae bacterium]HPT41625.1 HEPN domain-containing protein [Candidatus Gastranaerophilaceae bacterium]
MDKSLEPKEWLKRALSNLNLGKSLAKGVNFEDLCFNFQQSVEKALKAILIKNKINVPRTHSISELINLLKSNSINIPDELEKTAPSLHIYAVDTRYPDNYFLVDEDDYKEALEIAQKVYNWAKTIIN